MMTLEQYEKIQPVAEVRHAGQTMRFTVPNRMIQWRVETLFKKEPSTIEWLDSFEPGSSFLDVGANIGLYSIYAATLRGCVVTAFEPESQNYAILNRNIFVNGLSDQVTAYCAAAMDMIALDRLFLSHFDYHGGGSCHSFGAEVGFDLKNRKSPFSQGCISIDIDQAIENRMLEVPRYIKIDVDGFEHRVVLGAEKTLADPRVESLLIEVNPHLEPHQQMVGLLDELGFTFDPAQFQRVARKEGAFEGVGEIIFRRKHSVRVGPEGNPQDARQGPAATEPCKSPRDNQGTPRAARQKDAHAHAFGHVVNRIRNSAIDAFPFPHAVIDDIFPPDYYQSLLEQFPNDSVMTPLSETGRTTGYEERLVTLLNPEYLARLDANRQVYWQGVQRAMFDPAFINVVIDHFADHLGNRSTHNRFGDALLVSDKTRYAIGPHTDAAHRLITFLFYLPEDAQRREMGTSIYVPKDPTFRCKGGPHHRFDLFDRLKTVEYVPNRLLVFARTDSSFHGVEPIAAPDVERHLLIYNIRVS